jgi:heat shock protein HtpX
MLNAIAVTLAIALVLAILGWLAGGAGWLMMLGGIGVFLNIPLYFLSGRMILGRFRVSHLKKPEILAMVEKLALDAQVKPPRVFVMDAEQPNAFSVGRHKNKAAIVVTMGLLGLEREEIESVLAHEFGHIRNRDILPMTLGAALGMVFSWLANRGYWSLFSVGERRQGNVLWMIPILILAPFGALFVRLSVDRSVEPRADYTSVMLRANPRAMASALRKASAAAGRKPVTGTPVYASHLFLVNPYRRDWFTDLFNCHPPVERRIEVLEGMRPG